SPRPSGRGVFLLAVALGGGVLCVGLYQVPQPLRGYVIGWLLLMFIPGLTILRFMRHYFRMKEIRAIQGPQKDEGVSYRICKDPPRSGQGVKVVVLENRKGGRSKL